MNLIRKNSLTHLKKGYHTAALLVGNTFVLFCIINLVLGGYFLGRDLLKRNSDSLLPHHPISFRQWPKLLGKYISNFSHETAISTEILSDYRQFFDTSTSYLPYLERGEPPFQSGTVNVHSNLYGFNYRAEREMHFSSATILDDPQHRDPHFDIFLFGGSTVFGYFLSDKETLGAYLTRELEEVENLRVINFGALDYGSKEQLFLYQRLIHAGWIPDMAVFIEGAHALGRNGEVPIKYYENAIRGLWEKQQFAHLRPTYTHKLPILRLVNSLMNWRDEQKRREYGPRYKEESSFDDKEQIESVWQNLLSTVIQRNAVSDRFSVRSLYFWQPHYLYKCSDTAPPFYSNTYARRLSSLYEKVETKRNHPFKSLVSSCMEREQSDFLDFFHYSSKLNRKLARTIADEIRKNI